MNVVLLANHCNTGGITTYIITLAQGLIKQGDKVWVLSSGGDCEEILKRTGATHVRMDIKIKSEGHPKLWAAIPQLMSFIKKNNIHIMHAQTRVTSVMAAVASKMTHVPYITTCHGFFIPRLFRLMFPCWGRKVIAISAPVKDHLEIGFNVDPNKIALILNGIDSTLFAPVTTKQRDLMREAKNITGNPVIGIIARLSTVKGIDVLIAAMPLVLQQFPNTCLWIVGQGDQETYLKECVKKRDLTHNVKFLPAVNQTSALLPLFDVFVMPSLQEGLGLSVMEAQASGVPVVASKVGGLVDLIEDGKTGLLVSPSQHQELAAKIIIILKNPTQAQTMATTARERIHTLFSAERMVEETRRCYE